MKLKLSYLLLASMIFLSCSALKQQPKQAWQKTGTATVDNDQLEVVLGTTYTILDTKEFGKIHLTHKDLDSLNVEKTGPGNFKATFHKVKDALINITNLKTKGHSITADFDVNVHGNSIGNHNIKIDLDKDITLPFYPKDNIKTYVLPVIHDFMANLLFQFQDNSCIEKAVKACGKGNVKSVDVSIFASSCAFICK